MIKVSTFLSQTSHTRNGNKGVTVVMDYLMGLYHEDIRELKQRCFLRDARQPEVRPFPFSYALTLTNLYC